jgi:hypothetical protein
MDRTDRGEEDNSEEESNDSEYRLKAIWKRRRYLEEEIEFVSIDSNEEDLVATDSNEEHEEQVSRGDDNNQRTIEIFAFANEAQQVMFAAAKTPAGCWLGSGR